MKTAGYVVPRSPLQINDSPWGLHMHGAFLFPDQYPVETIRRMTIDTGVKWARVVVHWRKHERAKGEFDWRCLDEEVNALRDGGIRMYFTIQADPIPDWHENGGRSFTAATQTPGNGEAFCVYVAKLVGHFGDRVRIYEFFNEPTLGQNGWSPEAYGDLIARAGRVIHDERPDAAIMAYVREQDERDVAATLARPGAAGQIDIVNYHYYRGVPEEANDGTARLRRAARRSRPDLPFWVGECGYCSSGDAIHGRRQSPWGYAIQAKLLLRHVFNDRLTDIEKSIYFLNVDFYASCSSRGQGLGTYGLIQHGTWAPKPSYYAMRNLTATIDDTWTRTDATAAIDVVAPGSFAGIGPHETRFPCVPFQLAMERAGMPMLAYWLPWRPQELINPATVRIGPLNGAWQDPVSVDLLSGQAHEAGVKGGAAEVPLTDYPMLLVERRALELADTPQQPGFDEIVSRLAWTYEVDDRFVFRV
ncbi:MAG: hypothetical protein JXR37_00535 [Kiritimatiellae bacterium]|nr:hypothetical protein [Kiritimatiellia bacterium]